MDNFTVFGLALALAMDAFAVALATGMALRQYTWRHTFRLSFHFGLFQFLMPLAGWGLGQAVSGFVHSFANFIAFALLAFVGGKMLKEGLSPKDGACEILDRDPTRGMSLVMLSVATSIDALAVGLSLSALGTGIMGPSVVIGVVAFGLTAVGGQVGRVIGCATKLGHRAECLGGVILLLIALRVLVEGLGR